MPNLFRFNDTLVDAILEDDKHLANEVERRLEEFLDNIDTDTVKANRFLAANGTTALPSYSFQNDLDTGIYSGGTGIIEVSSNNSQVFEFHSNGARTADGSAAAPSYSFVNNTDLGFFNQGTTGGHGQAQIGVTIDNATVLSLSKWTSSDTDISALLGGSDFGGIIAGQAAGHITIGIRDNGATDAFGIISGGGNFTTDNTYDTTVAEMRADGAIFFPNTGTTGTAANAVLNSSTGQLRRSTSSARFKDNIQPYLATDWVLELIPVSYRHTGDGENYIGFVAEDVALKEPRAGVEFEPGVVDNYDMRAVVAALVGEVKKLKAVIR